jgi:hypothetical protein
MADKLTLGDIRPEVQAFALLMEEKLRENDFKGGWQRDNPKGDLFRRLMEEADELRTLLTVARVDIHAPPYMAMTKDERILTGRECADIANFAMMIADVCGGLPTDLLEDARDGR